jgi:flagellar biosynthesis protein FliR
MTPVLHLEQVAAAAVFVGARIAGVMVFAPFLSSDSIAAPVKVGFTVVLTVLLYPAAGVAGLKVDAAGWLQVATGQFVVGLVLGGTLQFLFDAVQAAGQMVGVQTGYSLITILDPTTQADTPVLSIFYQLVALLIFLELNVHHWVLRGLAASFAYLPPGALFSSRALSTALLRAAGGIWVAALEIAAPVMAATLVADVALGFLGKASPQLPVVFVGLSVKNLLGLLVLAGSIALWPRLLERQFSGALVWSERLLHLAR